MANPNPGNEQIRQKGRKKTGGRQKGTPNKRTVGRQTAEAAGMSPLEFFEAMMLGKPIKLKGGGTYTPTIEDRKWGAAQAAPYRHQRLQTTTLRGQVKVSHEEALAELDDDEGADDGVDDNG